MYPSEKGVRNIMRKVGDIERKERIMGNLKGE